MSSAIRFSRSQSQSSQASDITSSTARRHREPQPTPPAATGAADISAVLHELPSSIPSALTHPSSHRTRTSPSPTTNTTTTTGSSSRERGESSSGSRRSVPQSAPEAATAGYPWSYAPPFPVPTAAAAAPVYVSEPRERVERDSDRAGAGGHPRVPHHHSSKHTLRPSHVNGDTFPFAVPNLPWLPPPLLHGAPMPDVSHGHPSLAHHFAALAQAQLHHQQHQQHQQGQHGVSAMPAQAAGAYPSLSYPQVDSEWPRPDQLPLPSTFPMPPRMLPHHELRQMQQNEHHTNQSRFDLFPPPPLPPWWFLQAMQMPAGTTAVESRRVPSRSSSSSSDSCSDSDSEDSYERSLSSSRASSPSPGRQAHCPVTPPARQRQPPLSTKFVAPAGWVETPTPLPRGTRLTKTSSSATTATRATGTSTTTTTTTSMDSAAAEAARRDSQVRRTAPTVAAPSVSRRALPPSDSADSAFEVHRPTHPTVAATRTSLPASTSRVAPIDEEAHWAAARAHEEEAAREEGEEQRQMQRVLSTAESYLTRIEGLYHRLRHRYEEVLLSPVKGIEQTPGGERGYHAPQRHRGDMEEAWEGNEDNAMASAYAQPRNAAPTRAPSQLPSPVAHRTAAVPHFTAGASSRTPARGASSASQSLRQELAMLESQWQRLEELKQHGVGAAITAAPSPSASAYVQSSPSMLSTASGVAASRAPAARDGDHFSNQSVMELINDRKHLLASTA